MAGTVLGSNSDIKRELNLTAHFLQFRTCWGILAGAKMGHQNRQALPVRKYFDQHFTGQGAIHY